MASCATLRVYQTDLSKSGVKRQIAEREDNIWFWRNEYFHETLGFYVWNKWTQVNSKYQSIEISECQEQAVVRISNGQGGWHTITYRLALDSKLSCQIFQNFVNRCLQVIVIQAIISLHQPIMLRTRSWH